jgi:hypothetical protein
MDEWNDRLGGGRDGVDREPGDHLWVCAKHCLVDDPGTACWGPGNGARHSRATHEAGSSCGSAIDRATLRGSHPTLMARVAKVR